MWITMRDVRVPKQFTAEMPRLRRGKGLSQSKSAPFCVRRVPLMSEPADQLRFA
jgi:hypothetical protein